MIRSKMESDTVPDVSKDRTENTTGQKRELDEKPTEGGIVPSKKLSQSGQRIDIVEKDAICRYCFEGAEEGELISPCACKGGQKYVHISCLRQWQRMALVSQPTHPAYYEDDVRHHKCNVCLSEFTCPPPTRFELMSSFTGPELAAMISVGFVIGSQKDFSEELEQQIRSMPFLRSNDHWIRGSYLITAVEKDDPTLKLPISNNAMLERLKTVLLDDDLVLSYGDKTFKVVCDGSLAAAQPNSLRNEIQSLKAPCELVFQSEQEYNCGDDHVAAVNLTRPISGARKKAEIDKLVEKLSLNHPAARDIEIIHYNGGPCDPNELAICIVPVGNGQGWNIVKDPKEALKLALSQARKSPGESEFGCAQTVQLKGLKSKNELNGNLGLTLRKNGERWLVRLANGSGIKVKPENMDALSSKNGRVFCFWGDARWSRTQLLGEIARGSWGLCAANITDIISPVEERWKNLYDRLAFAPKSAMSEEYMSRQMNRLSERVRHSGRTSSERESTDASSDITSSSENQSSLALVPTNSAENMDEVEDVDDEEGEHNREG